MQQADGWNAPGGPEGSIGPYESDTPDITKGRRNPETRLFASDAGNQAALQRVLTSEGPAGASSHYRPWLEIVAPLHRGAQAGGEARNFQPFLPARPAETLSSLIHDARNMVAALDLYCDLLEEPGVLSASSHHYAGELRLVGGASRRLLEKLAALDRASTAQKLPQPPRSFTGAINSPLENLMQNIAERLDAHLTDAHLPEARQPDTGLSGAYLSDTHRAGSSHTISTDTIGALPVRASRSRSRQARTLDSGGRIEDLAADLAANQSLLAAIAGPGIAVDLSISAGHRPLTMASEDLTRILVNLCRNAADVMPAGGQIQIELSETSESLLLTFSDNGPGIPESALEAIFSSGFSSHGAQRDRPVHAHGAAPPGWPTQHRGLGLAIVRSLVSAAGGSVWAANRKVDLESESAVHTGAVISLEFPLPGSPLLDLPVAGSLADPGT